MKQPIILRVFKSNQLKEVKQFDIDQIVVGSNQESQLNLVDDAVSPIHCLIEKRDAGYYICDLGSKSGTFKNGQAILDEPVVSGDELIIGPFKIVFFVGVPKPVGLPKESNEVKSVKAPVEKPVQIKDEKTQALDKVIDDDKTHSNLKNTEKTPDRVPNTANVRKPEIASKGFQREASKKRKYSFAFRYNS